MNTRREFFRKAGIVGAAIAAPVATTVVVTMPETKKENDDISHLKPEGDMNFVLNGNSKPNTTDNSKLGSNLYLIPNAEYQNRVEMSVGKDDRLWIKVGDEWKRVAVES